MEITDANTDDSETTRSDSSESEDSFDDIPFDGSEPPQTPSGGHLLEEMERNERAAIRWQAVRDVAQQIKPRDASVLLCQQHFLVIPDTWHLIISLLVTHPLFSTVFETAFLSARPYLLAQLQSHDCLLPTATISDVILTPEDWENYLDHGPESVDQERQTPRRWRSFSCLIEACMEVDLLIADEASASIGNTILTNEELEVIEEEFWRYEADYKRRVKAYEAWLKEENHLWEVIKMRKEVAEQLVAEESWR